MATFTSDGTELAFLDEGSGDPVLQIHGFASSRLVNWVYPGWVDTLKTAGRRVIAIDNRGHGESEKLYNPDEYRLTTMAGDAARLLDHLGIERADVMGYSMGARIAATLAIEHPARVRSLILGGLGAALMTGMTTGESIAQALEADSIAEVSDPTGRTFRQFAEQTKSDRLALAACIRSSRQAIPAERAATIACPTLIAIGTKDLIAGSPTELAAVIPGSEVLEIPGRDHMVAVGDRVFKQGVVEFLARRP